MKEKKEDKIDNKIKEKTREKKNKDAIDLMKLKMKLKN
jgi:hypothetical protein